MQTSRTPKALLHERDAADYLGVSVYLLQRWRCNKAGPSYVRIGGPNGRAIRYELQELDRWIEVNRVVLEVDHE